LRVTARCKHFNFCGGCTWQSLAYEDQLKFKEGIVRETLNHLGGFPEDVVERVMRPIIGISDPWYYRNKMELSFGLSDEGELKLGFHLPKRRYDVLNVEECFLQSATVAELVGAVRRFAIAEGLTVFHGKRNEGLLKNLIIREGKNTGELMVNLETSMDEFKAIERFATLLTAGVWKGRINSLIWTRVKQERGTKTQREHQVLSGEAVINEEMHLETGRRLRFEISPDAFFQPNTKQGEVLYATALELAGLTGEEVVYDLYCGTGTIGLFCAHKAKQIYGFEVVKNAIVNARENATRNGIKNAEFEVADVKKLVKQKWSIPKPDVVIVDPPRAGLEGDVCEPISKLGAQKIVYVSCNPATLARDLQLLTQLGYRLELVQPVDMFPQTYHIENVALLVKS
ncbi:MAG: 23S rRNA (uracil(1939)-C(5))-methyltransferase RlmD, partial [Candidatus Peregrinibacteria bacterium]|nr:23S rRNA (uracil(1939)-C(5))-methyltransferase RlmD [Candidatus Peregrinibacteria bacterium]